MTSQYLALQNVALSATVWRELQWQLGPPVERLILGSRGGRWGSKMPQPHVPIQLLHNTPLACLAPFRHSPLLPRMDEQTLWFILLIALVPTLFQRFASK